MKMLSVKDVSQRLGVRRAVVDKLIHSGQLVASNVGTGKRAVWRIDPADLEAFLESRKAPPPPAPPIRRTRRKPQSRVTEYF